MSYTFIEFDTFYKKYIETLNLRNSLGIIISVQVIYMYMYYHDP